MKVSRRDFLRYCGVSAATLGLTAADLGLLEKALANPNGPTVIWLQGAGCSGCSVSFLNRVFQAPPETAADVLVDTINLVYHPTLMSAAGDTAVAAAETAYNAGGYILAVEGGVPTALGGAPCWAWTYNGADVTFEQAVRDLSVRAPQILSIGTCAAWGGIPAAPPNPTGVRGVGALTGRRTINIPGCPPHPDWIVWAIGRLLLGRVIALDAYGRPTSLFNTTVHDLCPRREAEEAESFGIDRWCLEDLGCRGPDTLAPCGRQLWNGNVNWCVDANAPCIGCTRPDFPGTAPLYGSDDDESERDD